MLASTCLSPSALDSATVMTPPLIAETETENAILSFPGAHDEDDRTDDDFELDRDDADDDLDDNDDAFAEDDDAAEDLDDDDLAADETDPDDPAARVKEMAALDRLIDYVEGDFDEPVRGIVPFLTVPRGDLPDADPHDPDLEE